MKLTTAVGGEGGVIAFLETIKTRCHSVNGEAFKSINGRLQIDSFATRDIIQAFLLKHNTEPGAFCFDRQHIYITRN